MNEGAWSVMWEQNLGLQRTFSSGDGNCCRRVRGLNSRPVSRSLQAGRPRARCRQSPQGLARTRFWFPDGRGLCAHGAGRERLHLGDPAPPEGPASGRQRTPCGMSVLSGPCGSRCTQGRAWGPAGRTAEGTPHYPADALPPCQPPRGPSSAQAGAPGRCALNICPQPVPATGSGRETPAGCQGPLGSQQVGCGVCTVGLAHLTGTPAPPRG